MQSNENNTPQAIPTEKIGEVTGILSEARNVLEGMNKQASADLLQAEARSIGNRPYRVAVVGAFKNGKSTLLNAAFLGQDLLFADTMEATCVATELSWGQKPAMKIFPYLETVQSTFDGDSSIHLRTGEEAPVEVPAPTPKDIRVETSADTPADREFKARRISKVSVELPCPSLRGITVVDSPGIDSTSGAVLDAALRIIPSCDSVLFVTKGGQLSRAEEEFLQSGVLDQGIARAMVVINHFDNQTPLSTEGRREHIAALRARLRELGRGHLQVTMVDAKSWLNATVNQQPSPSDAIEFSAQLKDFINKDLAKARLEKSMELTKREIRSAMLDLAAVTQLREKTEAERAQIAANLAVKTQDAASRLDNIRQDFEFEFTDHLNQFRNTLRTGITSTVQQAKVPLRAAPDLSSLADQLSSMQTTIRPLIEARYIDATRSLKRDLQSSNERFTREVRAAIKTLDADTLRNIGDDLSLPPIPAPVIVVLDYLLVIVASPLPMVADIILRMLADRFPEIRKIMPTGLAKSLAQGWIEKQLDRQTAATLDEIEHRIDSVKTEALSAVGNSIQSLLDAETAPLKKALRNAEENKLPWSPAEVAALENQLKALYERSNSLIA